MGAQTSRSSLDLKRAGSVNAAGAVAVRSPSHKTVLGAGRALARWQSPGDVQCKPRRAPASGCWTPHTKPATLRRRDRWGLWTSAISDIKLAMRFPLRFRIPSTRGRTWGPNARARHARLFDRLKDGQLPVLCATHQGASRPSHATVFKSPGSAKSGACFVFS